MFITLIKKFATVWIPSGVDQLFCSVCSCECFDYRMAGEPESYLVTCGAHNFRFWPVSESAKGRSFNVDTLSREMPSTPAEGGING